MLALRLFSGLLVIVWTAAVVRTLTAGRAFQHTSLGPAWRWGAAAEAAWLLVCLLLLLAPEKRPLLDQANLWAAVLTLCPLIAALGARRPTSRVWTWFIIVPLIAVLSWPGTTVLLRSWPTVPPLQLQAPAFVSFALVLLMGMGNYLGTRFTVSALLAGGAAALSLVPLSSAVELHDLAALSWRSAAASTAVLAVLTAFRQARQPARENSPIDRLWFDFRDAFGIVWSIRLQERLNATARQENWAARLGPLGCEWDPAAADDQRRRTAARMTHALRWHLRRFVDPAWIDRRLGPSEDAKRGL